MSAAGRVAVVSGGTSDIGAAIARALGTGGVAVAVGYHSDKSAGRSIAYDIEALGGQAIAVEVDVTQIDSIVEARQTIEALYGPVNVLVNCAARVRFARFLESDPAEWSGDIDVTLVGTMRACHVFAPSMAERRWGRIVNIVAEGAIVGEPSLAVASAAKAGVLGLTRTLALDLAKHGITVNAVSPGFVPTSATPPRFLDPDRLERIVSQYPMGRLGRPEDVATIVTTLVSEQVGYVTGQTISVSGGYSVR
jgi:NAD(P)-dependent dehydrogenase (short-subunit alcohol dehydrogenase family)